MVTVGTKVAKCIDIACEPVCLDDEVNRFELRDMTADMVGERRGKTDRPVDVVEGFDDIGVMCRSCIQHVAEDNEQVRNRQKRKTPT